MASELSFVTTHEEIQASLPFVRRLTRLVDSSLLRRALVLSALGWSGCTPSGTTPAQPVSAADCAPTSSASEAARCDHRRRMSAQRMKAEMQGEQRLRAREERRDAFIDRNGGSAQPP